MKLLNRYSYNAKPKPATDFKIKKDSDGNITNPQVKSRTKQAELDYADINTIIANGIQNRPIPINAQTAIFSDFTQDEDFHQMQNKVAAFKQEFEAQPSNIRSRFENDPAKFLAFMRDTNNKEEAIKMGILPKPVITRKKLIAVDGSEYISHQKDGIEFEKTPIPAPVVAPASTAPIPAPTP